MKSLRSKLWLGFGTLLVIVVAVSALSVAVFTRYSHALERVFRENYDSAVFCDSMIDSLDQLNTRAQRLIWEEGAARRIDKEALERNFNSSLVSQLNNCTLPGEDQASHRLALQWSDYRSDYDKFDQTESGRSDLYKLSLLPRYEEMKRTAQSIADMNMSNMISVDGQAKRTLVDVRNTLLILVITGTLLAAVVVWAAGVGILRPLKELTRSTRQIEAGNLDLNIPVRANDEIGELAEAFNSMAGKLREFKQLDHDRLMRSQQTTQLAIDSLPDAVFVIGPEDTIEIANDAAGRYFGITMGRNISSLGLNWLTPLYQEVKARSQPVEPHGYKSAIQLFVDGKERFLLPRVVPMLSPDNRQVGVTAIIVDVTQLRQVDEAKSSLVSTVSHELRTPLTSQRLLLGLLISTVGPQLTPSQRRMLEVAKADSDRLYRTIDELLSISRIESGRAQYKFAAMAPRDIVTSSAETLRELFAEKRVLLGMQADPNLPRVRADSPSIHSALTNLLSNALKFTPSGGRVTIEARHADQFIAFSVTDSGPGIPVEFRPRIFEKFFRVPAASGPSGAGLGLSITKNIVEAHGGRIEFECPVGGGTVFRFYIPLAEELVPVG